jgi:hypothetical protein
MTGLPRLALGTAVLTAERLAGRASASSPFAIAVGLADQGRKSARSAAKRLTSMRLKAPAIDLRQVLHDAGARGAIAMSRSRRDAEATLRSVMDNSFDWAEQKVVPKVVEEMMPQIVNNIVPKILDGVMPQIRTKVLPVIIDDLAHDPNVRTMITEQSQSAMADATLELRETSADADDRLEIAFRRLFRSK